MALAENLKYLRKRKNLTQKELSDISGVSCNSIINYENSRRTSPPISVLKKLAIALDVGVDELTASSLNFSKMGRRIVVLDNAPMPPIDDWEEFMHERGERDIVEQLTEWVKLLNKEGCSEALKRVYELTEIPRYRELMPQPLVQRPVTVRIKTKSEEVTQWPEDAPPTAAEPNPGSDQTDAGK